jgi:hypothetical protein
MFGFGAGRRGPSLLVRLLLSISIVFAIVGGLFHLLGAIPVAIGRAIMRRPAPPRSLALRLRARTRLTRTGAPVPSAYGA